MAATPSPFTPKQAYPKTAALFEEIIGNSSEQICRHIFTLLPPFTPHSLIHDNGSGTGQVTAEVMDTNPPLPIKIIATDANEYQVLACRAKVEENGWPVETEVMRAQELTFPDEYFTHSFTNFVVSNLDEPEVAAGHIWRTLKKGGVAVVSTWAFMPHDFPMKKASEVTRGSEAKFALHWGGDCSYLQSKLKDFMLSGGFEERNIKISTSDVFLEIKDSKRWATILWSYLGARDGGWYQEDEDKWDEAIEITVQEIEKSPAYQKNSDGTVRVRFIANVSISTK
ncbi:S-adenosyl-L-methionine-dependent methyltransferase [Acephala macrosclerotiorum]|nr:S-adenosyl-L-methionine-dependent methyltransferase [Acephala macrosclerotiorum]